MQLLKANERPQPEVKRPRNVMHGGVRPCVAASLPCDTGAIGMIGARARAGRRSEPWYLRFARVLLSLFV